MGLAGLSIARSGCHRFCAASSDQPQCLSCFSRPTHALRIAPLDLSVSAHVVSGIVHLSLSLVWLSVAWSCVGAVLQVVVRARLDGRARYDVDACAARDARDGV